MRLGDLAAGRYRIEALAGAGGMGEVFRAHDTLGGASLAVKVLRSDSTCNMARFEREALALAELQHPVIVRYVAHGIAASGEPYLVMEWLEGEDLASRLKRGKLTVEETVGLGTRVAEALTAAHARGIVHRDLKPSNIFLVDGNLARVKLLDFGIAQLRGAARVTRTGAFIGTPGYVSPEQAAGAASVDARADVFSLGCVLYECLTGEPAFPGDHVMAILAKILADEPPSPRACLDAVPPALDDLVKCMLARDVDQRPRDMAEVITALAASVPRAEPASPNNRPDVLGRSERQAISLLLLGPDRGTAAVPGQTRGEGDTALIDDGLGRLASTLGGRFEPLPDGSALLLFTGPGLATELAVQATRAALVIRTRAAGRPIAVVSGRMDTTRSRSNDTLERAAAMISRGEPASSDGTPPLIILDPATADLLDARFEVLATATGLFLRCERDGASAYRSLLGRPTWFVGRESELRALAAALESCVAENEARTVLITAAAGLGKSRLQHEFVERARARHESLRVWTARGDPMRTGAPFALLGQLVRHAAGLAGGEPLSTRREMLQARVAQHVEQPLRGCVAEFLGEIADVPFPDDESVQLRAARYDAKLFGDQLRRAWLNFVRAESGAHPVLIVLEDLHWGDASSIEHIDAALRFARDLPLMVLGLARPELFQRFPALWSERELAAIRLGRLSRKACERLIRDALGAETGGERIAALVERSEGNPFFLEELVRAATDGREDFPGTVITMMQARLAALPAEVRRVVRAGSVFGEVFWRGAIAALVGGSPLDACLAELEEREIAVRRESSMFRGESEFIFRHGLLRESAYEMLTQEDRVLGHRLAAEWCIAAGEPSALVIAEHYDRAGERRLAAGFYGRAAEQALMCNDLTGAILRAERAAEFGTSSETGELILVRAEAHFWRGEFVDAERLAHEAMAALPPRSTRWYAAIQWAVEAAERLGHHERILTLAALLDQDHAQAEASAAQAIALSLVMRQCGSIGALDRMLTLGIHLGAVESHVGDDPRVAAACASARAMLAYMTGDLSGHRDQRQAAAVAFELTGNARAACHERCWLAAAMIDLGDHEEARDLLRSVLLEASRLDLRFVSAAAKYCLGTTLARLGELDEALTVAAQAVADFTVQGDGRRIASSRASFAEILQAAGELEQAEEEARHAVELPDGSPWRPLFLAILSEVLLARGHASEALTHVRTAVNLAAARRDVPGEVRVHLAHSRALAEAGDVGGARDALARGRERLLSRAAKIGDPHARRRFMERVPENAHLQALASTWLAAGPSSVG